MSPIPVATAEMAGTSSLAKATARRPPPGIPPMNESVDAFSSWMPAEFTPPSSKESLKKRESKKGRNSSEPKTERKAARKESTSSNNEPPAILKEGLHNGRPSSHDSDVAAAVMGSTPVAKPRNVSAKKLSESARSTEASTFFQESGPAMTKLAEKPREMPRMSLESRSSHEEPPAKKKSSLTEQSLAVVQEKITSRGEAFLDWFRARPASEQKLIVICLFFMFQMVALFFYSLIRTL